MTRTVELTRSEAGVLRELLRDGASNHEIATRLWLSLETVKSHLRRIYRKAGVHDRTALAVAVYTGTVTPTVKGRGGDSDTRRSA